MMNPIISFTLKKGLMGERKAAIKDLISDVFNQVCNQSGITAVMEDIEFELNPPCGCPPLKLSLDGLPLEDLTCSCGKTKLIEYRIAKE